MKKLKSKIRTNREYNFYCPTCEEERNLFGEIEWHGKVDTVDYTAICSKCKKIVQRKIRGWNNSA